MPRLQAALPPLLAALALGCSRRTPAHRWAGEPEGQIYQAWMAHLSAKAGRYRETAGAPSDDWMASEQQQWPIYDLASSYLPDGAPPEVLDIRPDSGPDAEYRVVTAFHSADDNNSMHAGVIRMTVFARRSGDRWVFGNALPRLTRTWRRDTVGPITYVIEPGYHYDRDRARRAVAFIDSLATAFQVPPLDQVTYYLTSSEDEVTRIIGLETDRTWGPVGGLAQPLNHLLFSGIPAVGEEYRHELAHMVLLPLVVGHPATYFISEGVPTRVGGTTGMDFPTAARGLAEYLMQHPEVTLDTLLARQSPVAQFYPAGAVFVDMAYKRGGTAAVKALFDAGPTSEAFRAAAERLFGKPWPAIAADWRAHALSFLPPGHPLVTSR